MVQENPQMLETLLQQLGTSNPHIARMISENPDQFLEILAEGGDDGMPVPRPAPQAIAVTAEERDAIERV